MSKESAFVDKDKLSPYYIPKVLPHREIHVSVLQSLFEDFLEKPGKTYQRVVPIIGTVGIGKTCTAYKFGLNYEEETEREGYH